MSDVLFSVMFYTLCICTGKSNVMLIMLLFIKQIYIFCCSIIWSEY